MLTYLCGPVSSFCVLPRLNSPPILFFPHLILSLSGTFSSPVGCFPSSFPASNWVFYPVSFGLFLSCFFWALFIMDHYLTKQFLPECKCRNVINLSDLYQVILLWRQKRQTPSTASTLPRLDISLTREGAHLHLQVCTPMSAYASVYIQILNKIRTCMPYKCFFYLLFLSLTSHVSCCL